MKKIVLLLIGEIKYDGRVQKEIKTLRKESFDIELIVSSFNEDSYSNYSFKITSLGFKMYKNSLRNFISVFQLNVKMYKILKGIKPDIVHCNDLNTMIAGFLYKRKNKEIKLIFDAHELYPESQKNRYRKTIWNYIERKTHPFVDEIIMPEKNRANYFIKKYNLSKRISIIPNYPPNNLNKASLNLFKSEYPSTKDLIKILYIGMISPNRDLEKIVLSIKKLPDNYCMFFMGPPSKGYKDILIRFILENDLDERVFIHDPVPNDRVLAYIKSSDIGIVFYKNSNINNYFCASNKLFEFIVNKKPVVTNDYPGLIEVVKDNNYGVCIHRLTSEEIAKSILETSLIKFTESPNYFWENKESTFLEIYKA